MDGTAIDEVGGVTAGYNSSVSFMIQNFLRVPSHHGVNN
jgi:hypothetical protein